jgi:glucose/arabinose dehydrogenase
MQRTIRCLARAALLVAIVASCLTFAQATPMSSVFTTAVAMPVRVASPPNDDRIFVVEQDGIIKAFNRSGHPRGVFLDISALTNADGERGLLGLAFSPDYALSGRFYVNYTDLAGNTKVARYRVGPNPDRANPGSAQILLSVDQPYSNHNGGNLAFGPDGMLYIGLGDGGSSGDPQNRAQNGQLLLGKMLRLDVSGSSAYAIPPDNPFLTSAPRDEIWATGLRNPWTYAFDSLTGDLWIADVGQNLYEEIDVQPANSHGGENYGWRLMEGAHCFDPQSNCNNGTLTLPIYEYSHGGSPFRCSISGGVVYRGELVPELYGSYLFADYCSGQIWSLRRNSGAIVVTDRTSSLRPAGGFQGIVSIGADSRGELLVVDQGANKIYRISDSGTTVDDVPGAPILEQNVPNPFNPRTEIAFTSAAEGAAVQLDVFDLAGRRIRSLVNGVQESGRHVAVWDGTDDRGLQVPAGIYVYRLQQGGVVATRKMALLE